MKIQNLVRGALWSGAVLLLAPAVALAQFPGDVFFARPSVAVPEGGTASMEVLLFSGATPVGAAHFEVLFDPAQAEIAGVEAGDTEQLAPGHVSVTSPGRASVVDLNGQSLTQPIGTSSLARIELRPLGAAGSRVPISIQVRSLLRTDSLPLSGRGFAGEILVVSPAQAQAAAGTAVAGDPDPAELEARAHEFRRPGQTVDLLEFAADGGRVTAVRHRVIAPDPAAPSEAAEP